MKSVVCVYGGKDSRCSKCYHNLPHKRLLLKWGLITPLWCSEWHWCPVIEKHVRCTRRGACVTGAAA